MARRGEVQRVVTTGQPVKFEVRRITVRRSNDLRFWVAPLVRFQRHSDFGLEKQVLTKALAGFILRENRKSVWSVHRWLGWGLGLSLMGIVVGCSPANPIQGPAALNSRYTDEQPALSGNGQFVAFVSNRDGDRKIVMYDLLHRQFVNLPQLNRLSAIAESPSLSRTGRYIVYINSDRGRPEVELYDRVTQRTEILTIGYQGWVRNPSISPDGRYIVFETSRRGQWDIEVLDRGSNVELDISDGRTFSRP